jgi:sulfite exporter TauE/SafE
MGAILSIGGFKMKFSQFMASNLGRLLRIVAGVVLIVIGFQMKSTGGYVLAIVGLVPLAAGVFDFCLLAPLLHMPFAGKAIRAYKGKPRN